MLAVKKLEYTSGQFKIVEVMENAISAPEGWELMSEEDFASFQAANEPAYIAWQAIQPPSADQLQIMIEKRIQDAMVFGQRIMREYAAKNVAAGYTVADIKHISNKLAGIQMLLVSGSLYSALEEIQALQPDNLITQPHIDEVIAKLTTYLGL